MDDVATVREKIDLVALIGETVTLKKAGRNFKGLCPFHSEKSPSFVVSPERQIWHCFGCQKGGDCFTFLMELDRIEFPEALKLLAARAGITLASRAAASPQQELRERLLSLHHLAFEYYHFLLTTHALGARGREYLQTRGVTDKVRETFGLGFAPAAWDNMVKFLRKKNFTDFEIEKSGLGIKGRAGLYDRFRDRLMFPLRSYRGQTIAFSGRVLSAEAKEAKYINSPETPLYTKGDTLFGLDVTKEAIRKGESAIIVEGEFDVISSFQEGISNIVAIKGSALTEAQIRLLKRFTERLLLALDQDVAGDAASRRGIELAEAAGLDIRVVEIPQGKDPDEAAREHPHEWKAAVAKAIPMYDFLITSACTRFNPQEAFGKRKISQELLPMLARIENSIIQAHYIKLIAEKLGVSETSVVEGIKKQRLPQKNNSERLQTVEATLAPDERLEWHILSLIVQSNHPQETLRLVTEAIDPSDFVQPAIKEVCMQLIEYQALHETLNMSEFSKSLPAELLATFDRAFVAEITPWESGELFEKELSRTIISLKKMILRRKIRTLSTDMSRATDETPEQARGQHNQELTRLTAALKALT